MNLITDELKEHYNEQDMHEVKDLVECVERMYRMWELHIALGQLEDADENINEICACMDDLNDLAAKKKQADFMTTAQHLKLMMVVRRK
ncbi:MAG: hypothetical protein ABF608_07185 [Sporolactobacillus sp.]